LKANAFHALQASAFIKQPACVLQEPIMTQQCQAVLIVMILAGNALAQQVTNVRCVIMGHISRVGPVMSVVQSV